MLIFAVDSVYSEYGVLADIGVTVLETAPAGGYKRFKELGIFRYLLKETKGGTADVLIWMLLQELSGETPQKFEFGLELTKSFRMALLDKMSRCLTRGERDIHNEYHFLLEFPVLIILWTHLPVEVK